VFVALERGYFAEQGIDLELVPFDSGGLMIPAITSGQLDACMGVPGPALFNALARGLDLKALLANNYFDGYLMASKDLVDRGALQSLDDLRGKRVSFSIEASAADYALRQAFYRQGLTLQDVEVHRLSIPDTPPALANGAVDVAITAEPMAAALEAQGIAIRWRAMQDLVGLPLAGFHMAGPSLLARGDESVIHFATAVVKGLRDYDASIQNNKIVDPAVREILNKWTNIPSDSIALASMIPGPPSGRLDLDDLDRQQEFWLREGLQSQRADLSKLVESKYLDAAVAKLR